MVLNADNAEDAERCADLLRTAGYRPWRHVSPFCRADNFFQKPDNQFGGLASMSLVGLPDDRDISALGASRKG